MIRLCISLDTFYRLQAFTEQGFKSECKVYEDHAVILVTKDVAQALLKKLKGDESLDDVIVSEIKRYLQKG